MSNKFVHLNIHSEYSVVDGIVRLKALFERANEFGYKALALTDKNNVYAQVKFYKLALKYDIKPIFGADVTIRSPFNNKISSDMTLLCMNEQGRLNLLKLISLGHQFRGNAGPVVIKPEWLTTTSTTGLLALSGGIFSELGQYLINKKNAEAEKFSDWAKSVFSGYFYISIARLGHLNEDTYIQAAYDFSQKYKIPLVAVNDVQFLGKADISAHKARVCIERSLQLESIKDGYKYTSEQYFKEQSSMEDIFSDIPEAVANSAAIAKMCNCLLYTSPSPRDMRRSRMPSSA